MLQDWVPVITRDSATQDREVIQRSAQTRPLSDAYISSMPAKRRRVRTAMQPRSSPFIYCVCVSLISTDMCLQMVQERRANESVFTNPASQLPELIRETAQGLQLQPTTSFDELQRDVSGDRELQDAFQQQVRRDIRDRCKEDDDLIPRRYPDTEAYFGNKKK